MIPVFSTCGQSVSQGFDFEQRIPRDVLFGIFQRFDKPLDVIPHVNLVNHRWNISSMNNDLWHFFLTRDLPNPRRKEEGVSALDLYTKEFKEQKAVDSLKSLIRGGFHTEWAYAAGQRARNCFQMQDKVFYAASWENAVVVRNLETKRVSAFIDHGKPIYWLQARGNFLCAGSEKGELTVWDLHKGIKLYRLFKLGELWDVQIEAPFLYTLAYGELITIRELKTGNVLYTFDLLSNPNAIKCLCMRENFCIAGLEDGWIFVWDLMTGKIRHMLRDDEEGEVGVSFLHIRDALLFSASADAGKIVIWNLETGEKVREFRVGGEDNVSCLHVCGDLLSVGTLDGKMIIWDLHTGCERYRVKSPKMEERGVSALRYPIDHIYRRGTLLWMASESGKIVIFDLDTGKEILQLKTEHRIESFEVQGDMICAVGNKMSSIWRFQKQ
jgi:WD40 repeat protein